MRAQASNCPLLWASFTMSLSFLHCCEYTLIIIIIISYWWSFGTESLNPAFFEISRFKHIGVTNLTFQGHVTSPGTWPFDSPYAISYWLSFGTKPLSLTVSEIFNVKCNAMVDVTLIRPLNKGQGHSFWYQSISHIQLPIGCQ